MTIRKLSSAKKTLAKRKKPQRYLLIKNAMSTLAAVVVWRRIADLRTNPRNSRVHSRKQIHLMATAIRNFGFLVPVLVDESLAVVAGHARLTAAVSLGMMEVPTLMISGLSDSQKRAFVISDNRLAELAGWDDEMLRLEFLELIELGFDVEQTSFETGMVDILLDGVGSSQLSPDDFQPEMPSVNSFVSQLTDVWLLGPHRLLCGSALDPESYKVLLGNREADLVITDPPYNVPVAGHVSGLGRVRHAEFAMASGEMSEDEFICFLTTVLALLARHSRKGSIHFIFMDWRHLYELLAAGREIYSSQKNLVVWNKNNAGMGSLYRSKHELVLVFQNGDGPFVNNVQLGATGRYRVNVWDYPGMNSMHKGRADNLALHPTVKPVALVADAIRDCSKRNDLVLDPFCGSGTTILAAHRAGRVAAAMEIAPAYVDVAIQRWEGVTGTSAVLAATGQTFAQVRAERLHKPTDE